MPDLDAIGAALALRYAPGALTPPAGEDDIRSSTDDPPGQLAGLPLVVVFLDAGQADGGGSGTQVSTSDWIVRLYLAEVAGSDLARLMGRAKRWTTVLFYSLREGVQLGGLVDWARITGYRLGEMDYSGRTYAGVELRVRVTTSEGWAATA